MEQYTPILILLVISVALSLALLFLSHILGPKRYDKGKFTTFECGMPLFSDAKRRISIKFYLVAILFLIFDLEAAFLYPWAVLFKKLGFFGFIEMLIFILILVVGLIYAWKAGALEWQ